MRIYIAKHYWKERETATWEVSDKFDREIFQYIKNNYSKFIQNRVNILRMNSKYIYFIYDKKKDIYDRDITEITAFQCRRKTDMDFSTKKDKPLEFIAFDREDYYLMGGVIGILVIISLSIYFFLNNS